MKKEINKTVFVAISGGVDSSVAALLLKEQGYKVVGVFMKNWTAKVPGLSYCPWEEDQRFARQVAGQLGIPFYTWDFEKEYYQQVFKYFLEGYRKGETPNPDVVCNKTIKFGLFLKQARRLGADFIATGHYVKLRQLELPNTSGTPRQVFQLVMARDGNKDQSYFLWTLKQAQLKFCLFPLGNLTKPEVREIARRAGLVTAEKKDSQGLCFVGPVRLKEFLRPYLQEKPGKIILWQRGKNGEIQEKVVGEHQGVHLFTLGQRQGIGVGGGTPYYVAKKDLKRNLLYICSEKDLPNFFPRQVRLKSVNWIIPELIKFPLVCQARYRYRQPLQTVEVTKEERGGIVVKFSRPPVALTPGQSIVFYQRRVLLGGGVIKNFSPS